jgi:hypothetical protein
VAGYTQLRGILNRLRKNLHRHQDCPCCQHNWAWITVVLHRWSDDEQTLLAALEDARGDFKQFAHECPCCKVGYARTTAELFTYRRRAS